MDINGTQTGKIIVAVIGLLAFGTVYNQAIEKYRWLAHRRPAEQVVIGVVFTLIVSGFMIGWMDALWIFILFCASGAPMLIGSWVRAAKDDAKVEQLAKDLLHE